MFMATVWDSSGSPSSYKPREFYEKNAELKMAIDQIHSGFFLPKDPDLFKPLMDSLLSHMTRECVVEESGGFTSTQFNDGHCSTR